MTSFRALLAAIVILGMNAECLPVSEKTCVLHIRNCNGRSVPIRVELAQNEARRQRGLMYRKNLEKNSGMLFVFYQEQYLDFWMKNTYIPLSIAYINADGIITEIKDMKPLDVSVTYPSKYPSIYALEVNRGWFAANEIGPGCAIELNGCIGKQDPLIGR